MKLFAAAVLGLLLLTGCDPGPTCVQSHSETRMEYTPSCGMTIGGKYDCGKMKLKMVTRRVCDRYEDAIKENK